MEEEKLPPGFRFHPTDEELITYYLTRKVSDFGFTSKAIADVDLNKCEPWDLPAKATMGVKEWYFFSLKDRKYPTGLRTNRATEAGYWKTTGKDKEIFRGNLLVGMKKTLVFYKGRAPKGEKTNWVMHEYRQETKHACKSTKEEWVVCRVFQKTATVKKPQQTTSSPQQSLDSPDITNTNEYGDNELPNLNSLSSSSDPPFITNINNNPPSVLQDCYDMSIGNNLNIGNCSSNLNNMNVNNWARDITTNLPSLSSWPTPSLLSPPNLSTVNSLLLKALQIKNNMYPGPRDQLAAASNSDVYSFMPPQGGVSSTSQYGVDFSNSNIIYPTSHMDKVVADASLPQQNQGQQQRQELQKQEEQPFNLDSMW